MKIHLTFACIFQALIPFFGMSTSMAQVNSLDPRVDVSVHAILPSAGERPVTLSVLPNGNLVYNNLDGVIYEIVNGNAQVIYTASDHNLPYVSHMEVWGDYMYLSGSVVQSGDSTMIGYVMQGDLTNNTWRTLAQSDPYYLGRSFNDHRFSSLLVSLDGQYVYVHSGTRTNAGEVHELSGVDGTINLRDQAIRGKLFKLPTNLPQTIFLPLDSTALENSGYLYAQGLRHLFAMAWGTDSLMYGGSNSDRRDVPEAFYQIVSGGHYGFPWWIGGEQNPLQFASYNPVTDLLLPANANNQGYYNPDPSFPPEPAGLNPVQPYKNIGPDGDKIRNPQTGNIEDASDEGKVVTSFTGHRSPTGLIFDQEEVLPSVFKGDGFLVCYTDGGNLLANDGHDLLQLTLMGGDTLSARQLISGFRHPIDVMIRDSVMYILDLGNNNGSGRYIYEVNFVETPEFIFPYTLHWADTTEEIFSGSITEQITQTLDSGCSQLKIEVTDPLGDPVSNGKPLIVNPYDKNGTELTDASGQMSFYVRVRSKETVQLGMLLRSGDGTQPFRTETVEQEVPGDLMNWTELVFTFDSAAMGGFDSTDLRDFWFYLERSEPNFPGNEFYFDYVAVGSPPDASLNSTCVQSVGLDDDLLAGQLEIFPNPVHETLTIKRKTGFTSRPPLKVQLMDIHGNLILEGEVKHRLSWDMSGLAAGIYILNGWNDEGEKFTKRVVRE